MMTDSEGEKRGSDWIDIVWASYENAFVNAKLYYALVQWAAIEQQLNNKYKADYYTAFAAKLKASFNKNIKEGGFWDNENGCYAYWLDKDKTAHGRNLVTPVNFMAIAYGLCDNEARKKTILDNIEAQMNKENLFFWPLALYPYASGEAKQSQYPYPSYENGDLFLSWGSVGVRAYAAYDPALAVKYVKNVLTQYSKDGLAFQRYGRNKQDGLGDDILSGNSLAIVGLYQEIYGINPLYNRFYLNPHITPELAGTAINYNFRNKKLVINLDSNSYSVADNKFKVTDSQSFGFNTTNDQLAYFNGNSTEASLNATTQGHLAIRIKNWGINKMEWQHVTSKPLVYRLHNLQPNTLYLFAVNGKPNQSVKSDSTGDLVINYTPKSATEDISVSTN